MPVGIIMNAAAVVLGGILGAVFGGRLTADFKAKLNMIFGAAAMTMGIVSIPLMENMPAVIFSVVIGTIIGLALHLGDRFNQAASGMQKLISKVIKAPDSGLSEQEFTRQLVTVIVLFCASGTGIYGSIVSGISGDHSILIAKSFLDFFTAMIFACSLGMAAAAIAVPQLVIFLILFFCAGFLYPLTTPVMIDDFKACGGLIMIATGLRIAGIKDFPIAEMIPAMLLVWPLSWAWTSWILPML